MERKRGGETQAREQRTGESKCEEGAHNTLPDVTVYDSKTQQTVTVSLSAGFYDYIATIVGEFIVKYLVHQVYE